MEWKRAQRICRQVSEITPWTEYEAGKKFEARAVLNDPRRLRIIPWQPVHEFARGRTDLLALIQLSV